MKSANTAPFIQRRTHSPALFHLCCPSDANSVNVAAGRMSPLGTIARHPLGSSSAHPCWVSPRTLRCLGRRQPATDYGLRWRRCAWRAFSPPIVGLRARICTLGKDQTPLPPLLPPTAWQPFVPAPIESAEPGLSDMPPGGGLQGRRSLRECFPTPALSSSGTP